MVSSRRLCFAPMLVLVGALAAQGLSQPVGLWFMSESSAAASSADLTTLRVGMLQGIDSLNPYIAYEDSSYVILYSIYDRLISYDEDLNPIPVIATSWEVGDWDDVDDPATPDVNEGENRLWRYQIKQDVTWHDGEPLTVSDVVYSINVNINESMWAYTPYISVKTAEFARAVNSTTVEVYLTIPNVHAECLVIPIVPEHIWSQYSVGEVQYSVMNEHPIGCGPFKFVEYVRDQYAILERNPEYHLGPVAYDRLIFQFYGSDQVMALDLKKGNIDLARFPPLTYNSLKGEPNVETAEVDRYYQSTIGFNCYQDPISKGNRLLLDDNIRRAMHLAINKPYLIDVIWAGYGDVGYGLPAPIVPYFHWEPETSEESLDYNVSRANAVLDAAGYDKRNSEGTRLVNRSDNPYAPLNTPLNFKFQVRNDAPEDMAAAPYIREMWQEIGVKVWIEAVDEGTMETDIMYAARHDVYIWYWSGDFDPTYILAVHTTDQIGGWNDPFWSNETYDELWLLQLQQTDAERQQTVFEMQRIWYWSSGMIVTTYPYDLYAWSTLHFTNWGDPVAHPGRTMTPYFGSNPLFLGLEPVTSEDEGGGQPNYMLIAAGVGIAAAIAVLVALTAMKKRRTGASEKESRADRRRGLE